MFSLYRVYISHFGCGSDCAPIIPTHCLLSIFYEACNCRTKLSFLINTPLVFIISDTFLTDNISRKNNFQIVLHDVVFIVTDKCQFTSEFVKIEW